MRSFEKPTDIFTRLSVFDSPKGSSDTFKTHKIITLYFKRRYLIIYKYSMRLRKIFCLILWCPQGATSVRIVQAVQQTITQKMADQGRSDLDVVFTMILCATNYFIW